MASKDLKYLQSSIDSDDSFPPVASSQVSVSSADVPLTPSMGESFGEFSVSAPKPGSNKKKIYYSKKRRFQGNKYSVKAGTKFVKVGITEDKTVRTPTIPTTTVAARKLTYTTKTTTSKLTIKVRDRDGKLTASDVFPVKGNIVMNAERLVSVMKEMAVCKVCQLGSLQLFEKSARLSCAQYMMIRCDKCFEYQYFWTVDGKSKSKIFVGPVDRIPKRNSMMISSVLGGRLIGLGESKLKLYHAALDILPPPARSGFADIQRELLLASEYVAKQGMDNARYGLEDLLGLNDDTKLVHAVVSYDGAYQIRSGKSGGGFSPYCFASAISTDTGKVVAYEVGCNTCRECTLYENKLREKEITEEEHQLWLFSHMTKCPATYSDFASVHLESLLALKVVTQAFKRGIIYQVLSLMVIIRQTKRYRKQISMVVKLIFRYQG